jgi:HAD superfamily hydrolase (TIGR01509 family)
LAAILFDVGGPILPEEELYEIYLGTLRSALRDDGVPVTDEEFDAAVTRSILSFVPSLTKAVAWQFTRPDAAKCLEVVAEGRRRFGDARLQRVPRPEIADLLRSLAKEHVLGLAANASAGVREALEPHGLLRFFRSTEVSGDLDFGKPDPRFFLHILANLDARPEEAIMIGDRLDNDIIPARGLGMKTILFRTGPYSILAPRTPDEVPDAEVQTMQELGEALQRLCA